MPFACLRRKSKTKYKLNHNYDSDISIRQSFVRTQFSINNTFIEDEVSHPFRNSTTNASIVEYQNDQNETSKKTSIDIYSVGERQSFHVLNGANGEITLDQVKVFEYEDKYNTTVSESYVGYIKNQEEIETSQKFSVDIHSVGELKQFNGINERSGENLVNDVIKIEHGDKGTTSFSGETGHHNNQKESIIQSPKPSDTYSIGESQQFNVLDSSGDNQLDEINVTERNDKVSTSVLGNDVEHYDNQKENETIQQSPTDTRSSTDPKQLNDLNKTLGDYTSNEVITQQYNDRDDSSISQNHSKDYEQDKEDENIQLGVADNYSLDDRSEIHDVPTESYQEAHNDSDVDETFSNEEINDNIVTAHNDMENQEADCPLIDLNADKSNRFSTESILSDRKSLDGLDLPTRNKRRSGIIPKPVHYDEEVARSLVKYPKDASDEKFIKEAITKNEFLSKVLSGKRLQDVVDAMYKKKVKAREKIVKEGQNGTHMYVAAEGEFEVMKKGKGLVHVTRPGEVFGELAILYNAKRLATVKAATPAKVWVIDGTVYQQLMNKSNLEEQEEIVSFLQNVPILNEAGVEVLKKVAALLKPEFFETGTVIVREGDTGDKFYIIAAGSVTVSRKDEGFINQLHKGNCFGEKALLEPITRQATIIADAPGTDCLTLTQKHFINHFGKIEDISNLSMPSQSENVMEEVKIDEEYAELDLRKFKILKTLGVGGFGRVEFVQHKEDPSITFALKYLKKYEMVQQEQQHHVINEMRIQMACRSPFIIRMYRTFKDNKYIYFLMEICLGGDLWSLLQKQPNKRCEEKGAKFIAACVLEALAYLHDRNIVFRDLKPENLLIDNNGYIKLTDFGFAKRLAPLSKTGTFAGTPEYVAPEIILSRGHDKAVDYWAYGILLFEILNGRTPFRSNDPSNMRTYNNILNGLDIVDFPSHVSLKAKSLITKLLKRSPEERLGCLRKGVDDVRNHKWLVDVDWEKLNNCKLPSPYKPKLTSNVDWRHIDHFKRDNDIPPDETSGWDEFF